MQLKTIFQYLVGMLAGWLCILATFNIGDQFFDLTSLRAIVIQIIKVAIATLPYWFLRNRYPLFARGILIGIALIVLLFLFLSQVSFSE